MRQLSTILLLLLAVTAALADEPVREPFPSDYTPSPCALPAVCNSFERGQIISAGHSFQGFSIKDEWLRAHYDEMLAFFQPICAKAATCYGTHNSTFQFCNDALMPEYRSACDRFPYRSDDWNQCTMFVETWALGHDTRSLEKWKETQKCVKEKMPFTPTTTPPIVWIAPAKITIDYKDYIRVYALDPVTKRPIQAPMKVEGQKLYASSNPTGVLSTYYPFKWPVKFNRVPNAEGHTDLVAPMITVEPEGYPPVTFRLPAEVPKMVLTMSPKELKRGRNVVTITARDAETGAPVEARVMYGEEVAGETNKPFELELKRGEKRRELWVTSLFHRYSDMVVLKAQ